MVSFVRMAFLTIFGVVTAVYVLEPLQSKTNSEVEFQVNVGWWLILGGAVMLCTLVLTLDLLTPNKRINTISSIIFGLLAGLLVTGAFSAIIDMLVSTYDVKAPNVVTAIKVLLGIAMCYLTISIVVQTQDDFRLVIPYVEFTKQYRGSKPLLLDTSALIDGRIADVAMTGFIQVPVVIPQFVVLELQTLADSGDRLKRGKGKRGLEIIGRLQRTTGLDLSIDETPVPGKAVDQQLVEMARSMPASIVTADTALNKVATIRGITVLNLNDLGNALKPALIPGSVLSISLVRAGEQPGQGVGYLDDGTMVVVEQSGTLVGTEARVEVTSSLQTSAGRLIFGKLADDGAVVTPQGAAPLDPLAQADLSAEDEDAEGDESEHDAHQADPAVPSTPTMGSPRTIVPPTGPTPEKTPFPPKRGPRNPLRNPRR